METTLTSAFLRLFNGSFPDVEHKSCGGSNDGAMVNITDAIFFIVTQMGGENKTTILVEVSLMPLLLPFSEVEG